MKKTNCAGKINNSSKQVLKTLKMLVKDDYTMAELVEKLNQNEPEAVFNSSVVSKYINTCRYCGIEIPKIQNKYCVTSLPFGIDFSEKEVELIQNLVLNAKIVLKTKNKSSERNIKNFEKIIAKIHKYANKQLIKIDNGTIDFTKCAFEKALNEHFKIKLFYKNKITIECIPIGMVVKNGKTYFVVNYNNKQKKVDIKRLSGLEILKERFEQIHDSDAILFKITGELVQRYSIREFESVFSGFNSDAMVILNREESKETLIPRLLRYDALCEVMNPKSVRDYTKNIIDETLANYNEV